MTKQEQVRASKITILEAVQNGLEALKARGYGPGGDIYDDLELAVLYLRASAIGGEELVRLPDLVDFKGRVRTVQFKEEDSDEVGAVGPIAVTLKDGTRIAYPGWLPVRHARAIARYLGGEFSEE